MEHHSNIVPWQMVAEKVGAHIDVCPLTADGLIDLDWLEENLTEQHKLVALAHVSNVLGSVLGVKRAVKAAHTVGAKLMLDGCQVPRQNVLGEVGKGYKIAIETLNEGRIGIGAQMIGLAKGALGHAVQYTRERKQFGKAIAEFQLVQGQIARMATEIEAARLLVYNAARLRDAGRPFLTEAAMAKLYSSEVAERVTSLAINLYGGFGYVKDYPVEKLWRDAKIGQIYEGTSNMQLVTIAKQVLG